MFHNIDFAELEINRNKIQPGGDAAFGCSFTFGYGVNHEQSWPALMGLYNCGQSGSSNDRIARLAIEYINTYSPKNIYIMWTIKSRREWIDEENNILRFKVDDSNLKYKWQEAHLELSNTNADNYNYQKNKLLLDNYNMDTKIHTIHIDSIDHTTLPLGSDNSHPGIKWHEAVTEYFKI